MKKERKMRALIGGIMEVGCSMSVSVAIQLDNLIF